MLRRRGFELMPLQSPGTAARLQVPTDQLLDEVRLQTCDGRTLGGADAILVASRHIWWATPLWAIALVPGARPLLRWLYRRLVPYRYCVGGRCGRTDSPCASRNSPAGEDRIAPTGPGDSYASSPRMKPT